MASEWLDYQLEDVASEGVAPAQYWCSAKTTENYPNLSNVMRVMLCIPHSNASSERVFSMLKKIVTNHRSLLCSDTVNSLLRVKLNEDHCCTDTNFSINTLKKLKKAATNYNDRFSAASATPPSTSQDVQESDSE